VQPFTFIGAPADSVGRGGGAELAPAVLRELGLPEALGAADAGDLEVGIRGEERDPETGLLAAADVLATTAAVRTAISAAVAAGERPLLCGGCCSILPGALAGARDAIGELSLVHLDGHADLYDGETSASGEAADMPISVALGLGPAAWVEAAGGASVQADRTALVGYRDRDESLRYGMRQPEQLEPPPILLPVEALRSAGPGTAALELTGMVEARGRFWLHLDVDVLDQDVFPATDYLMPGGLTWDELAAVLAPLLSSPRLIGVSLGCHNPEKDPGRACGRALVDALSA
jgi:arginase